MARTRLLLATELNLRTTIYRRWEDFAAPFGGIGNLLCRRRFMPTVRCRTLGIKI
jgi:hypothetical protein